MRGKATASLRGTLSQSRPVCRRSFTMALSQGNKNKDLSITSKFKMPSGHEIPILGYGVYQIPANDCERLTLEAFKAGYRHIDSARVYRNEQTCAEAIRNAGIPRDEIFFTSKVPPKAMGYDATRAAIDSSFKQTGLEYIDLYLIHSPYGGKEGRKGTWLALVEAQQAGKIRSIGVSNYGVHHLDELEAYTQELEAQHGKGSGGAISVGQWELHPWLRRPDIVEWCRKRDIVIEAYCPIVRGERFDQPALQKIAAAHARTPAQILIRWSLQMGFLPLVKSATPSRIRENIGVFDFELSERECEELATDDYSPCSWDPTKSTD